MAQRSSNEAHRPVEPLESRHVFLDTQVYRALGHNPANRALTLLKEQIDSHRVALHVTDITLLEVKRQIRERVLARHRELRSIEKDLAQWRVRAPKFAPKKEITFDADALAINLFDQFVAFLCKECDAVIHQALAVAPTKVFDAYFARRPPFDGEQNKEFPDGFAVEVLKQWCQEKGDRMHVVTEDKALTRAASSSDELLPLKSIHEVLSRAAANLGADGEQISDAVLNNPAFDYSFEEQLRPRVADMGFIYAGDFAEGEAYEGELLNIERVGNWSVVSLNDRRITLILDVNVSVKVEVQYEDRHSAIYDREDDLWFGAEIASTDIEDEIDIEVLVEIERETGIVSEAKLLTNEARVSEHYDWDK